MPRSSEHNEQVPATWGEYLELYRQLAGDSDDNRAVEFIEQEAARATHGLDELVTTPDVQLRQILMPMLKLPRQTPKEQVNE